MKYLLAMILVFCMACTSISRNSNNIHSSEFIKLVETNLNSTINELLISFENNGFIIEKIVPLDEPPYNLQGLGVFLQDNTIIFIYVNDWEYIENQYDENREWDIDDIKKEYFYRINITKQYYYRVEEGIVEKFFLEVTNDTTILDTISWKN